MIKFCERCNGSHVIRVEEDIQDTPDTQDQEEEATHQGMKAHLMAMDTGVKTRMDQSHPQMLEGHPHHHRSPQTILTPLLIVILHQELGAKLTGRVPTQIPDFIPIPGVRTPHINSFAPCCCSCCDFSSDIMIDIIMYKLLSLFSFRE